MTVNDFIQFMKDSEDRLNGDEKLIVALQPDGDWGMINHSKIDNAYVGFDWEAGHIILTTKDKLRRT